jgi:Taurine catabolism dioxygenase TauD, TfdA family
VKRALAGLATTVLVSSGLGLAGFGAGRYCQWLPPSGPNIGARGRARATVADNVYSHAWSVGDTVIWDNRGVVHRAAPYDPDSVREMLRTTVLGDEPIQ